MEKTFSVEARMAIERKFYSIRELADRWCCSRGTVYNRLRSTGAPVLDFAGPGRRGRKVVSAAAVQELEKDYSRQLR